MLIKAESFINNPDLYEKLIFIPKEIGESIANNIFISISKKFFSQLWLILSVGVGNGRIDRYLIKKMLDENKRFVLVGIDINERMLKKFKSVLYQMQLVPLKVKIIYEYKDFFKEFEQAKYNSKNSVLLYFNKKGFLSEIADLERMNFDLINFFNVISQFNKQEQFGWKKALTKGINLLNKEGMILLNDEIGDFACLDGNFSYLNETFTFCEEKLMFIKLCYKFLNIMKQIQIKNFQCKSTDLEIMLNWLEYDKKFLKIYNQYFQWEKKALTSHEIIDIFIRWAKDSPMKDIFPLQERYEESLENKIAALKNDSAIPQKLKFTQGIGIYIFKKENEECPLIKLKD